MGLEEPCFWADGLRLELRARSTWAASPRFVVALAGHFDRGHAAGQSAAEALLEAWERAGVGGLGTFDGAWVAMVFERASRRLHLIRDRFGIRRLYFSERGSRLAFATSPRHLLGLPWVSRELARENLSEYLSFRYVHPPRTLLRDVQALPPGEQLVAEAATSRLERWYQLAYCQPYAAAPEDQATLHELDRRMNRAVAARASGKDRVAVFLSGGLDSSAIAWYASRLGPVSTFTVGVEDAEEDETPYGSRVATILGTEHTVRRINFSDFEAAFPKVVAAADFPVPDPAAIAQYLLAVTAREHADVILSGDGGDEIFGGRVAGAVASQLRLSTWLGRLPGPLRLAAAAAFRGQRPEIAEPSVPVGLARLIGGLQAFNRDERAELLRDAGWVRESTRKRCLEPFYRELVSDPINEILHVWLRGRMPGDGLARAGVAASLAGVGLREPLLDRDLVQFCAGIPGHWKVRTMPLGTITKWPLRQLLKPVLGRAMVNRPKRVLPGPWSRWSTGPAAEFLQAKARQLREDRLGLFRADALDALLAAGLRGERTTQLWTLIFLDSWAQSMDVR